jgi:endogenous inhibitor of DNA gyrase (YacG/DUF329 family)
MASTGKTNSCPICDKAVLSSLKESQDFPFCSERCKLADLGKWLDGDYAIPGEPDSPLD